MQKSQHTQKYDRLLAALRRARKSAGLTQLDVAHKLDTYASYVSKCESGERRIDVVELAEFCSLYGITIVKLLKSVGIE
jgi:transcriptional regulator with XRE-family HTH domain